jgi:hypothetical protein
MLRKKMDKKIPGLNPEPQNILICKKKEYRPFLEILFEKPENISRKNLGTLIGIFQVNDYSEDSSYITNYLISIIKKEYFSGVNRGAVENFETALHKANLALAKLVTHENINWIGHLNAICAVIEKNNILLSQTGTASAFLLRNKNLIEITEGLSEQEQNPLKTFQDVISGKIELDDKLIFAPKEIFELFSPEELKKSALKFSRENFIQFLNTAFVNELDQVPVLVIDIEKEKEAEIILSNSTQKIPEINAFSQTAFRKKDVPNRKVKQEIKPFPEGEIDKEEFIITESIEEIATDFTDEKTGHIYLKETKEPPRNSWTLKTSSILSDIKDFSFIFLSHLGKFLKELNKKIKTAIASKKYQQSLKNYLPRIKKIITWLWEKVIDISVIILRLPIKGFIFLSAFSKKIYLNYQLKKSTPRNIPPLKNSGENTIENFFSQTKKKTVKLTADFNIKDNSKKILPDFSKIKNIAKKLDFKQKLLLAFILFSLFVIPYWIAKWDNKPPQKAPTPTVSINPTPVILPLEKDKNVIRITGLNEVYSENNLQKIINLNNKLFALKNDALIDVENKKNITLPQNFQSTDLFFAMKDLNLLFFAKNNQLISLAPTTGKFTTNTITFPDNGNIVDAQSYLTYAYLLDQNNNQIYRYPRADGGFGQKTAWLKDNIVLKNAKNIAINENIFVLNGDNEIIRLAQGKKQDYTIETTATPILPDKIYTKQNFTNLYILDKTNSRIIKLDMDGHILNQYYNEQIKNAKDFSVSEESNSIYFLDENGIKSFTM